MLLPVDPNTPDCKIFTYLNNELLYFFEQSISAANFSNTLFIQQVDGSDSPCFLNRPTKEKFHTLFRKLQSISQSQRQDLYNALRDAQDITQCFSNINFLIPVIPTIIDAAGSIDKSLFESIKELTSHLYEKTKKIKMVESIVVETINQHFIEYKRLNGLVCKVCGLSDLTEEKYGVDDNNQWISDYDHLLAIKHYPYFAVHPKNFLPTCHTCNSKAKGSKDLIKNKSGRRIAFYPYDECCHSRIKFIFEENSADTFLELNIEYTCDDAQTTEKVVTWKEIYQVPSRVKAKYRSFWELFAEHCDENTSYQEFYLDIQKRIRRLSSQRNMIEQKPNNFWNLTLYKCLDALTEVNKEAIFIALKKALKDNSDDAHATYNI